MRTITFKKGIALLLALIMTFALASVAFAYEVAYEVAVNRAVSVYNGINGGKALFKLSTGESVQVIDTMSGYYRVLIPDYDETRNSPVYIPAGSLPSGIPTTYFQYSAKITADKTPLNKYHTLATGTFTTLKKDDMVNVISSYGSYYFVKYDRWYGYVAQSACVAIGAVATAAPAATAAAYSKDEFSAYGHVAKSAILYAEPSKNSKVIGQFNSEGVIGIIAQTGTAADNKPGYYYVSIKEGGYKGFVETTAVFVSDAYLGKIPTDIGLAAQAETLAKGGATAASGTTGKVANCSQWVSMRESASSSSKRLAKVPLNASVTILGTSGNYTKVTYNSKTGYILSTYIKK